MSETITSSSVQYIKSSDINIFPYSRGREDNVLNDNELSEETLTRALKYLSVNNSCVLSRTTILNAESTPEDKWAILLNGYVFEFKHAMTRREPLYAGIQLSGNTLNGKDTDEDPAENINKYYFKGLILSNNNSFTYVEQGEDKTVPVTYSLQLCDEHGNVPEASWVRFNANQINVGTTEKTESLARRLTWQPIPTKTSPTT